MDKPLEKMKFIYEQLKAGKVREAIFLEYDKQYEGELTFNEFNYLCNILTHVIRKKKVKNLTDSEKVGICRKYNTDCHDCPLAIINGCEIVCLRVMMDKEVEVDVK